MEDSLYYNLGSVQIDSIIWDKCLYSVFQQERHSLFPFQESALPSLLSVSVPTSSVELSSCTCCLLHSWLQQYSRKICTFTHNNPLGMIHTSLLASCCRPVCWRSYDRNHSGHHHYQNYSFSPCPMCLLSCIISVWCNYCAVNWLFWVFTVLNIVYLQPYVLLCVAQ